MIGGNDSEAGGPPADTEAMSPTQRVARLRIARRVLPDLQFLRTAHEAFGSSSNLYRSLYYIAASQGEDLTSDLDYLGTALTDHFEEFAGLPTRFPLTNLAEAPRPRDWPSALGYGDEFRSH
jgi:hypothetical protein